MNLENAPGRLKCLFLHFFDIHFLKEKGRSVELLAFKTEMRRATRLAVASAAHVLIPAASYFESPMCSTIIDELAELQDIGVIELVGSSLNVEEFIRERSDTKYYSGNSIQGRAYREALRRDIQLPYVRRQAQTTIDIVSRWNELVQTDELPKLLSARALILPVGFENKLETVPEKLGAAAFVSDHVFPILNIAGQSHNLLCSRIRDVINEAYFQSYIEEFGAGVVTDLSYLSSSRIPSAGPNLSFRQMIQYVSRKGMMGILDRAEAKNLFALGDEIDWQIQLSKFTTFIGSNKLNVASIQDEKLQKSILCITVAQPELDAVTEHLTKQYGKPKVHRRESGTFIWLFVDQNSGSAWYVAKAPFQGETEMASFASQLNSELKPALIFMVGMCMAIPGGKLKIGDVFIPNEVTFFDHRRETTEKVQVRPHGQRTANGLYSLAELVASTHFKSGSNFALVLSKGLASATVKIENPQSDLIKYIKDHYPDVIAYDMEGAGFYNALRDHGNCLWIKAVADNGEAQGGDPKGQEAKAASQAIVTANAIIVAEKIALQFIS